MEKSQASRSSLRGAFMGRGMTLATDDARRLQAFPEHEGDP